MRKILWLPLLLLLLTGCVRYDVGVNFEGQYRGTIEQHIELGKQLTSFSQTEARNWLDSIEKRAQKLQGKTKRGPQEVTVTIPFNSGQELVDKFNIFFSATSTEPAVEDSLDILKLNSSLSLQQSNLLLLQRNLLVLNVDLRALGVLSEQGSLIVSPGSLINLEFALAAPLGVRSVDRVPSEQDSFDSPLSPPEVTVNGRTVWQLQPGKINHIEAIFWVPNSLGLGAVAIALLVLGGFYIKYRHFPWVPAPTA